MVVLGIAALVFMIAYGATAVTLRLARKYQWYARGNERTVHQYPTPELGGAAITAAVLIGVPLYAALVHSLPWWTLAFLAGFLIMALTGLVDDIHGLAPREKLICQAIAALALTAAQGGWKLPEFVADFLPSSINIGAGYFLSLSWIIGITNALNLIDGIDSLAVSVSLVIAAVLSGLAFALNDGAVAVLGVFLFAAGLGFLPYNLPTAKMFVGDTGALALGYALAGLSTKLSLQQSDNLALYALPFSLLSLPMFDTFAAIARRRRRWSTRDLGHLHYRLLKRGWSHRRIASTLAGINAALALTAATCAVLRLHAVAVLLVGLSFGIWLSLYRSPRNA